MKNKKDIWTGKEETVPSNIENNQEIANESFPDKALNLVENAFETVKETVTKTENKAKQDLFTKKYPVALVSEQYVILDVNGNGEQIVRTNKNPIKIGDVISPKDV